MDDKFNVLFGSKHLTNGVSLHNFDMKLDNNVYERMHSRFLKNVLNVNKYSSNSAVRGELGRFPLAIKILSLSLKYWHSMNTNSPNVLLKCALKSEILHNSRWLQSIEYLLKTNGLAYVWNDLYSVSTNYLYQLIKCRLSDQYIQTWFANDPYKSIGIDGLKSQYICSNYLSHILSPNIRSMITKLRVNNSVLRTSGYTHIDNICPECNSNAIESVNHFLLDCPKSKNIRNIFLKKVKSLILNYNCLSKQELLCIILDADIDRVKDKSLIKEFLSNISNFIKNIYMNRLENK